MGTRNACCLTTWRAVLSGACVVCFWGLLGLRSLEILRQFHAGLQSAPWELLAYTVCIQGDVMAHFAGRRENGVKFPMRAASADPKTLNTRPFQGVLGPAEGPPRSWIAMFLQPSGCALCHPLPRAPSIFRTDLSAADKPNRAFFENVTTLSVYVRCG